jgi:predicted nucleic acid-binding protein
VIIVDTSVWIDAVRDPTSTLAGVLDSLIETDEACLALPVRLELLSGLRRRDRDTLRRGLAGIPLAVPTEATWHTVERWLDGAADAGERFAIVDLVIAALAHELTGLVWSLDRDFERMSALGFVQSFAWS